MQRDMDYIRDLLLKIEAAPSTIDNSRRLLPPDATSDQELKLNYHLEMLVDETGLVKGIDAHSMEDMQWLELKLSWQGHEFLDTVRDPEVWSKTKDGAKKAGNFAISFIFDLAKAYGKHVAKERLGIDLS